jgi:hypothetical protein
MIGRFLWILLWESVQNVAPIVGFAYATYHWVEGHRKTAIAVLVPSTLLGSLAISTTEPLIYGEPASFTWGPDVLVTSIVFVVLALLALFYIGWQAALKWDLIISFGLGAILTAAQAIIDPFPILGVLAHILSMTLAFYIFLRSTRWAIATASGWVILARAFLINVIGSAIIVMVDYGYLIIGVDL